MARSSIEGPLERSVKIWTFEPIGLRLPDGRDLGMHTSRSIDTGISLNVAASGGSSRRLPNPARRPASGRFVFAVQMPDAGDQRIVAFLGPSRHPYNFQAVLALFQVLKG